MVGGWGDLEEISLVLWDSGKRRVGGRNGSRGHRREKLRKVAGKVWMRCQEAGFSAKRSRLPGFPGDLESGLPYMWPHSSGARPWASALIGKDPGLMAWWCLDGLPEGLAEPWRELWRLGSQPLHCVPASSPQTRNSRDYRNLRRRVKPLPRILKV